MRIVHVMAWYIPGMGYQENSLPLEQSRLGHSVEIITSDRIPDFAGFDRLMGRFFKSRVLGTGTFEDNGITVHRLQCLEGAGQVYLFGLRNRLKAIKPDIVQSHGAFSPSTIQTVLYSRRLDYRLFIDDHSHTTNFHAETAVKRSYLALLRAIYRMADKRINCFMPITTSSRSILESRLLIPREKMELLPLGANTRRFLRSSRLRESGRREYDIGDEILAIMTAGKFAENKDVEILIRAFSYIAKRNQNAMLLLVGNGPEEYMRRLKSLADETIPLGRVRFLDFIRNDDLPVVFNSADIGVWPGDPSITAIEGAATGLPLVVPQSESAYRLLIERNAAVGFTRGDANSLAERMSMLIDNRELRGHTGNLARTLTSKELSWESIAARTIELYSS